MSRAPHLPGLPDDATPPARHDEVDAVAELLALDAGVDDASRVLARSGDAVAAGEHVDRRVRRGRGGGVVEFVRLIMVTLFAAAGWQVAVRTGPGTTARLLLGIVLGTGVGFVLGGVFGRTTASAASDLELEFRRVPAADLLAGAIGMILGLIPAMLLSVAIFHLPPAAAFPAVAFIYFVAAFVGYRVGRAKSEELFALFGVKPRASGTRAGEVSVLDSSAILDGRVTALIHMGFLSGSLLVTRGVLEELQAVADSSDAARRTRGKRALDLLVSLKRDPGVDIVLVDDPPLPPGGASEEVDARLVRLARDRGGVLVTNDSNLARLARALDVPVRSIHALADALRPTLMIGERVDVALLRPGKDSGQAVGHLEDGTMVVVQDAADRLGETARVSITNVLQTASGRMMFGRLADMTDAPSDAHGNDS
jgi:uncharacterized protein YacL